MSRYRSFSYYSFSYSGVGYMPLSASSLNLATTAGLSSLYVTPNQREGVVIVGYGEMFTNIIAATLDANCEIIGVMRRDVVRHNKLIRFLKDVINPSLEYNYIKSYNLPEIIANKGINSAEFKWKLLKLNPDIMFIASWGEKIKKEIYDIPKIATINVHPSLLPKYRGPNPYFWVIKNQEESTGVSFHLVDSGYDTGAILAQEEVKIYPSDTGEALKKRVVLTARGVACELLKDLSEDVIIPLTQREELSSYYSYPDDLELDFEKTAEENYAIMRAIYSWDKAYFYHKNTLLLANPHKTVIENNTTGYKECGTIVEVDYKKNMIAVLCKGGKILKMSDLALEKWDKPFTSNYIKLDVKVGDII